MADISKVGTVQESDALGLAFDNILGGGAIAFLQDSLALSTGTALDAFKIVEVLSLVAALELVHNGLESGFLLVGDRAEDAGLFRFGGKLLVNVGIKLVKDLVLAFHQGISKLACDSERGGRGEGGMEREREREREKGRIEREEVSRVGESLVGMVTVGCE